MQLRRVLFIGFALAAAISACHGGRSGGLIPSPQNTSGQSRISPKDYAGVTNSTVCVETATPGPDTGTTGGFTCYLQPSSSVTLSNLSMKPKPGDPGQCSGATWSTVAVDGTGTPPPGLTTTFTPSPTGNGDPNCSRVDTVNITLATNSTLPSDFTQWTYDADGAFTLNGTPGYNEKVVTLKLRQGLRIKDVDLGTHVENTTVHRVAGQHVELQAELDSVETGDPQDCIWTIPHFSDETTDYNTPTPYLYSPQPSQANLNGPKDVKFYWTGPFDPATVSVTCTDPNAHDITNPNNPIRLTAIAQYGVKVPTSNAIATYGSFGADSNYPPYGDANYPSPDPYEPQTCAATPTPYSPALSNQQVADGAAHLYRLDELSGTSAADSIGGSNATYGGSYQIGNSLPLTGDEAYVVSLGAGGKVTIPFTDPNATAFTIEAVVKPISGSGDWGDAVANTHTSNNNGFELFGGPKGAGFYVGNGSTNVGAGSGTLTADGQHIYHLVGVFTGSHVKFYVNGALVSSASFTGAYHNTSDSSMLIGQNPGGNSNNQFQGSIQSVAIYPIALSDAQIANHYKAVATLPPWLHYGNPCSTIRGISWTYTATADADEAGSITMWQLFDRNATETDRNNVVSVAVTKLNNVESYCLDTVLPLASPTPIPAAGQGTWQSNDSPGIGIPGQVSARLTDHLDDYFVYKAPDMSSQYPSMWVVLDRLQPGPPFSESSPGPAYSISSTFANGVWANPPTIDSSVLQTPSPAVAYNTLPRWGGLYSSFNPGGCVTHA